MSVHQFQWWSPKTKSYLVKSHEGLLVSANAEHNTSRDPENPINLHILDQEGKK